MPDQPEFNKGNTNIPEDQTSTDMLLKSSLEFAKYITSKWPQVNTNRKPIIEIDDVGTLVELAELPPEITAEPSLNYYFAGSLATMLLAQASSFTPVDETTLPQIKALNSIQIPQESAQVLKTFARPMGDLDFIPLRTYTNDPNRLKKGGGGPSYDELPEDALASIKKSENQIKVMCDPLTTYGTHLVAKVEINGQTYYIPRPDAIVGYKILHILQNYEQKPEKFNADFAKLIRAFKGVYTDKQLSETTYGILEAYEISMQKSHQTYHSDQGPYKPIVPNLYNKVMSHPKTSPEIKSLLEPLKPTAP